MVNGGYTWEILVLPAEAEENDPLGRKLGEFLWGDDAYGYTEFLRQQKAMQPPGNWSALYQQRPTRPEG